MTCPPRKHFFWCGAVLPHLDLACTGWTRRILGTDKIGGPRRPLCLLEMRNGNLQVHRLSHLLSLGMAPRFDEMLLRLLFLSFNDGKCKHRSWRSRRQKLQLRTSAGQTLPVDPGDVFFRALYRSLNQIFIPSADACLQEKSNDSPAGFNCTVLKRWIGFDMQWSRIVNATAANNAEEAVKMLDDLPQSIRQSAALPSKEALQEVIEQIQGQLQTALVLGRLPKDDFPLGSQYTRFQGMNTAGRVAPTSGFLPGRLAGPG